MPQFPPPPQPPTPRPNPILGANAKQRADGFLKYLIPYYTYRQVKKEAECDSEVILCKCGDRQEHLAVIYTIGNKALYGKRCGELVHRPQLCYSQNNEQATHLTNLVAYKASTSNNSEHAVPTVPVDVKQH